MAREHPASPSRPPRPRLHRPQRLREKDPQLWKRRAVCEIFFKISERADGTGPFSIYIYTPR